jgi:hypothetical protein
MFSSLLQMNYTFFESFELIRETNLLKIAIRNYCALPTILAITLLYDDRIN